MKQLVIFPKGSLFAKDKERLSKEGYLAIECEDPSKIVMPMPSMQVGSDELLIAALDALQSISSPSTQDAAKAHFTDKFRGLLKAKQAAKATA